ncbi:MAG: HD domain-containing protein [Chlamydiota bacterium]|nr:HD domain-containing protein [Chlamydiota bacterium]
MTFKINEPANEGILAKLRASAQRQEENTQHPLASLSKDHSRYKGAEDDHRLPYKRDVDRIVHSKAYSRYTDKTQVVYLVDNDHITHRSLHVQLVSNFARGVAEILKLNLDLVEAIALGHDVGHPPFGHEGEHYLSSLSKKKGGNSFAHPHQSCRLFYEIEPLNLGLAVYDGFLCHDGGMTSNVIRPRFGKTWEDHFEDRETKLSGPNENIIPGTLEGALVKLSDTMSYVGKDIEDAISLNILSRDEVPNTILGNNNRSILTCLATDIIQNSYEKDYIAVSEEAFEALKVLRTFNFRRIYTHEKLKVESEKIKKGYRILFEILLEEYTKKRDESYIWKNFLFNKNEDYLEESSDVQFVVDFISGMTDKYFVKTLQNLIVPKNIII